MVLPIRLPMTPMLAKLTESIPPGMVYEPKWDGWRALLARDGSSVRIWSRHGTELTAHFPELVQAALTDLPERVVLDGEIVIIRGDHLDYTLLASRHASADKALRLAEQWPASFVAFDLLALEDAALLDQPWTARHELLVHVMDEVAPPLLRSPTTRDLAVAREWFSQFEGAGLDGVVAKPPSGQYQPGVRALLKIKHKRTADVVVGGFRYDRNSTAAHPQLGSLLLGLFDDRGLHFVGVCAGFPSAQRGELARMFASLELARKGPDYDEHPWSPAAAAVSGVRVPDHVTRWTQPRDEAHLTLPLLVAEVCYDYLHDGERFRSNTDFQRWRPDRVPEACRFDQLDESVHFSLADVLARGDG